MLYIVEKKFQDSPWRFDGDYTERDAKFRAFELTECYGYDTRVIYNGKIVYAYNSTKRRLRK